jgi:uncharacterized damage-inducible protein DinB
MTRLDLPNDDTRVLLSFLDAQRSRALEIIAGLDEQQLRTAVLPSGWTPLGMIEHLGHAERHWFQEVALGAVDPLPWPDDGHDGEDPAAPFTSDHPTETVLAYYRATVATANRTLRSAPLSTPPIGRHGQGDESQVTDLRFIVLHMMEETARHLGHLDAARELLDGRTGLGQDDL